MAKVTFFEYVAADVQRLSGYSYVLDVVPRIGELFYLEDKIGYEVVKIVHSVPNNKVSVFGVKIDP